MTDDDDDNDDDNTCEIGAMDENYEQYITYKDTQDY